MHADSNMATLRCPVSQLFPRVQLTALRHKDGAWQLGSPYYSSIFQDRWHAQRGILSKLFSFSSQHINGQQLVQTVSSVESVRAILHTLITAADFVGVVHGQLGAGGVVGPQAPQSRPILLGMNMLETCAQQSQCVLTKWQYT